MEFSNVSGNERNGNVTFGKLTFDLNLDEGCGEKISKELISSERFAMNEWKN